MQQQQYFDASSDAGDYSGDDNYDDDDDDEDDHDDDDDDDDDEYDDEDDDDEEQYYFGSSKKKKKNKNKNKNKSRKASVEVPVEALLAWLLEFDELDPAAADENGITPLHLAAYNGRSDAVVKLLSHYEASVRTQVINRPDSRGRTPLHCAAISNCESVCALLELQYKRFRANGLSAHHTCVCARVCGSLVEH